MLASAGVWKRKREVLLTRRNPLFEKFRKDPDNPVLAGQIKLIDDEIAECTKHMTQHPRPNSANSSAMPALELHSTGKS